MQDVNGTDGGRRIADWSVVHDSASFGTIIRREKLRADRDGNGFSLVVIDLAGCDLSGLGRRRFLFLIHSQLRTIDSVGWLDERHIAVVLPRTMRSGAEPIVERIIERIGGSERRSSVQLFSYPCQETPIGGGQSAELSGARQAGTESASLPPMFCIAMPRWKRTLDLVGASLGLILLSPVFAIIAPYIRAVSPGPVFFRQLRVGYGGRLFTFIKFRTMHCGNNEELHKQHIVARLRRNEALGKLDDIGDPRIIPGGRILRRACIDELPQLINVLRGEMSLVGPRPCVPYEAAELLQWHAQRFDVVPGLTGLWQVSGKNKLSLQEMIRLDISYAANMSPFLDLKILALTVPAIFRMFGESIGRKIRGRSAAS